MGDEYIDDMWRANTANVLTNTEWYCDEKGDTIKTICCLPTKKGILSVVIHRKMRGTAVWLEGGVVRNIYPIYVRNEAFPKEVKDIMIYRADEDPFYEILPFPIYEEIMNYRINYCEPRSLADVIISHMGQGAMRQSL